MPLEADSASRLDAVLADAESLFAKADTFGKDDPRSYVFATRGAKPKDLGGGKKLVGGVVMKPKPKIDQRKYDELTRKMQALENSGKPFEAVEREYERLLKERDNLSRRDEAIVGAKSDATPDRAGFERAVQGLLLITKSEKMSEAEYWKQHERLQVKHGLLRPSQVRGDADIGPGSRVKVPLNLAKQMMGGRPNAAKLAKQIAENTYKVTKVSGAFASLDRLAQQVHVTSLTLVDSAAADANFHHGQKVKHSPSGRTGTVEATRTVNGRVIASVRFSEDKGAESVDTKHLRADADEPKYHGQARYTRGFDNWKPADAKFQPGAKVMIGQSGPYEIVKVGKNPRGFQQSYKVRGPDGKEQVVFEDRMRRADGGRADAEGNRPEWFKGQRAGREGKPLSANPHSGSAAKAWASGWKIGSESATADTSSRDNDMAELKKLKEKYGNGQREPSPTDKARMAALRQKLMNSRSDAGEKQFTQPDKPKAEAYKKRMEAKTGKKWVISGPQYGTGNYHVYQDDASADADYNEESVNKAIAAQNRSGRGKIGGREGKMIHALLKGNTGYASRNEKKDAAQQAPHATTIDSLFRDAEALFQRADAAETGRWDAVPATGVPYWEAFVTCSKREQFVGTLVGKGFYKVARVLVVALSEREAKQRAVQGIKSKGYEYAYVSEISLLGSSTKKDTTQINVLSIRDK